MASPTQLTTSSLRKQQKHHREVQFVDFIKILMLLLKRNNEILLLHQIKQVIRECVAWNRGHQQQPGVIPLQRDVAYRLRQAVGPVYYIHAQMCYSRYCGRR